MQVDIKARAAELLGEKEDPNSSFWALVRELKNRALRKFADSGEKDDRERTAAWHDLQAIGRLENYIRELAGAKQMEERKAERRKARHYDDYTGPTFGPR